MSNIDKQWLQQKIADMEATRDEIPFGLDEDDSNTLAAMKLALASLEAEAVAFVMADDLKDSSIISTPAYRDLGEAMERTVGDVVALYAIHPAPVSLDAGDKLSNFIASQELLGKDFEKVLAENIEGLYVPGNSAPPAPSNSEPVAWLWSHRKHPSEVTLVRPEDDERAEGAHWSGWSCQALYAAPPEPVSVPDEDLLHMAASAIEDLLDHCDPHTDYYSGVWADVPDKLRRAAMLQGAENAESRCTIQAAPALDSSPKIAESRCSNSPAIPDGWVACSERMPEKGQEVIVMDVARGKVQSGMIYEDGCFVDFSEQYYEVENPSHWMPLPAVPQQEVKP